MRTDVLSPPTNPDERRLLQDALAVESGADPLQWAAVDPQASYLAASIAFRDELSALRADIRGLRRARESGHPVPADIELLFDGLLNLDDSAPPLQEISDTTPSSTLRTVLERLRTFYRPAKASRQGSAELQGKALLVGLLTLPAETDPVDWLRTKHGDEVALQALRLVMRRVIPPIGESVNTLAVLHPHTTLHSPAGYRINVDEVAFKSSGFEITTRIRVPDSRRPAHPAALCFPQWLGFSQVADDLGNWYLTHPTGGSSSKRLRSWESELRTGVLPAISEGASELTFKAESSPLIWESADGEEAGLTAGEEVGAVVWQLALPSRLR